jgi:hypothetical protein
MRSVDVNARGLAGETGFPPLDRAAGEGGGMTQSCRQEGVRGNRRVPSPGRADAEHRRQRAGGSRGKPGFPRATEPQARQAA